MADGNAQLSGVQPPHLAVGRVVCGKGYRVRLGRRGQHLKTKPGILRLACRRKRRGSGIREMRQYRFGRRGHSEVTF